MIRATNPLRLELPSHFDMLDFVQLVGERMGQMAGFDEDSIHWIDVAIRESVINAIKHGNQEDEDKRVIVEFAFLPPQGPTEFMVRVVDQGPGFEVEEVADPLAPENMMRSSGRGIFFMRSFMDELVIQRAPEGGMEVCMVKKLPAAVA
jgi:serine/threonine-protein kinase RsbW